MAAARARGMVPEMLSESRNGALRAWPGPVRRWRSMHRRKGRRSNGRALARWAYTRRGSARTDTPWPRQPCKTSLPWGPGANMTNR